jgi:hypothetical protein
LWGAAASFAALDAVGLLGLFRQSTARAVAGFALAEEFRTSMQILFGLSCCPDFFTRFLLVSVYRDAVHVDTASANTNLDAQNSWNFSAAVALTAARAAAESDAAAGCWAFCSCEVHKSRL